MGRVLRTVIAPLANIWRSTSRSSWRSLPRPNNSVVTDSPGTRPIRLLLFGGGVAVGFGTVAHDVALAGHLGRKITALSRRGVTVEVLAEETAEIGGSQTLLKRADLSQFDAIVASYGGPESATFMSANQWRSLLNGMLNAVSQTAAPELEVFLLGIPILQSIPGIWGSAARHRAAKFDNISREIATAWPRVTFVNVDSLNLEMQQAMSSRTYAAWAIRLAPQIVEVLVGKAHPLPV